MVTTDKTITPNYSEERGRPTFDDRDSELLSERVARWNARPGPRVGDFILMLDGTTRRFAHNWVNSLQTTYVWRNGRQDTGSFYFDRSGYMSMSGSLDDPIPLDQIVDTGELRAGSAWFFHHDWAQAHNGVYVNVMCRVFRQTGEIEVDVS